VYLTVRMLENFYFFILFLKIPYTFPTICALIIIRKMEPFPASQVILGYPPTHTLPSTDTNMNSNTNPPNNPHNPSEVMFKFL